MGTALQNKETSIIPSIGNLTGILRFRRAIVTVLAANRLISFGKQATKKVTTVNPIDASRNIKVFNLDKANQKYLLPSLKEIVENSFNKKVGANIVGNRMAKLFPGSTMDVNDAFALDSLVRGYMKLLAKENENTKKPNSSSLPSSTTILCQRLSNGLFSIIRRRQLERKVKPIVSLTFAASGVQRHILSMTEQLHSSEIERKSLRATELKLREQIVKQRHALELNSSKTLENSYRMCEILFCGC